MEVIREQGNIGRQKKGKGASLQLPGRPKQETEVVQDSLKEKLRHGGRSQHKDLRRIECIFTYCTFATKIGRRKGKTNKALLLKTTIMPLNMMRQMIGEAFPAAGKKDLGVTFLRQPVL